MKKQPSRILCDSDGHSYLIPDHLAPRFKELLALLDELDWATDSPSADRLYKELAKFTQYAIDRPSDILIKDWEDRA